MFPLFEEEISKEFSALTIKLLFRFKGAAHFETVNKIPQDLASIKFPLALLNSSKGKHHTIQPFIIGQPDAWS